MLELEEIQSLVLSGFGAYRSACYLLFQIDDSLLARQWLIAQSDRVSYGPVNQRDWVINIGFSYQGFEKLRLPSILLSQFPEVFHEGMASPYRQRILGDLGENGPDQWHWGSGEKAIDCFVALFARDDGSLVKQASELKQTAKRSGLNWIKTLHTELLTDNKEHFGFRDGISQPSIKGLPTKRTQAHPKDMIEPGEFIMGYQNEYKSSIRSFRLPLAQDKDILLPRMQEMDSQSNGGEFCDFSKNGTFMVVRQLKQNVKTFWGAMLAAATEQFASECPSSDTGSKNAVSLEPNYKGAIRLASKMVGRWPNGAPLAQSPGIEPASSQGNMDSLNHFGYRNDPHGLMCPLGAHIRRAHPRDSLVSNDWVSESVRHNRRHRILRRGRVYGKPLVASMDPMDIMQSKDDSVERGLVFICINADIERQFEFIQHAWCNNTKFSGLYDEVDPLIGARNSKSASAGSLFTVPEEPLRKRYRLFNEFVQMRGGGYFFLPSRSALRFLSLANQDVNPTASDVNERGEEVR